MCCQVTHSALIHIITSNLIKENHWIIQGVHKRMVRFFYHLVFLSLRNQTFNSCLHKWIPVDTIPKQIIHFYSLKPQNFKTRFSLTSPLRYTYSQTSLLFSYYDYKFISNNYFSHASHMGTNHAIVPALTAGKTLRTTNLKFPLCIFAKSLLLALF
jgi:hypothetical protein